MRLAIALLLSVLTLSPLPVAAQQGAVSFLIPRGQIIVPSQDMVRALLQQVQIQNGSGKAVPYRLAAGRVSGGRVQGIRMSGPTQAPPGPSPLPQGFLLEVSGVILMEGTEMVIRTQNIGGALSADPNQASSQLLGAGAQALGGKDGAVLAILGGQEGEPLTGNIILIGE